MKKTIIKAFITSFLVLIVFTSCASTPKDDGNYETAKLLTSVEDYEKLGISVENISVWEDGMRTDGKEGSYEWWYTDAEFDNGTTVVVVFFSKKGFDVPGKASPTANITITSADGTVLIKKSYEPTGTVINASKEYCDVQINDNYLRYVDGNYELYFKEDNVEYNVVMESTLPMWRPDTGCWAFGDDQEDYFAWFVAQPSSKITGTLTIDGVSEELNGTGYHDHNWGNKSMDQVFNHWYWGRAKVGDYDIIACDLVSTEDTGFTRMPVFMIAKDGEIIEDDQSVTEVIREDTIMHPVTNKFYDNHLIYKQEAADGTKYTVEMIREKDISVHSFLDDLSSFKKFLAKVIKANPTYVRSLGEVILTIEKDGNIETFEQEGLWEQMFFGNNKEAYIWN